MVIDGHRSVCRGETRCAVDQAAAQGAPVQRDTRPQRRRRLCRTRQAGRRQPVLFHAARPPQLSRAGYHPSDPRWAAAARSDGREAARALTSAACLARAADRARLCLSPIRIQDLPHVKAGRRPDFVGTSVAFSPTTSAALRYWNMARQRYCRRLARYRHTLRVSADPLAKPAAHTRAESRGSRPTTAAAGERRTVCWREVDSNLRFPNRPLPFRDSQARLPSRFDLPIRNR